MEKLTLRMTPVILLVHLLITIMEEEIFIKHQSTITPKCPAIWLNAFCLNDGLDERYLVELRLAE